MTSPLKDNLIDFKRIFIDGSFKSSLYDTHYADKADAHAQSEVSQLELDWVAQELSKKYSSNEQDGFHILDVGCSTGHPLHHISTALNASRSFGIDINKHAIDRALTNYPNYHFEVYNGNQFPFESGLFHHLMIHHVIGHVASPQTFIQEAVRVLKPGGTISIITPNSFYKFWQFPQNVINQFQPDITVLRYFSVNSLSRFLKANGLSIVSAQTQGMGPTWCPPPFKNASRLRVMTIAKKTI